MKPYSSSLSVIAGALVGLGVGLLIGKNLLGVFLIAIGVGLFIGIIKKGVKE